MLAGLGLNSEDGDSKFLQNISNCLSTNMAYSKKLYSSAPLLLEPQILQIDLCQEHFISLKVLNLWYIKETILNAKEKDGCIKNDNVHVCNTGTSSGYLLEVPKCEVHNIRL